MSSIDRRSRGSAAEARAAALLEQAGLTILERNFRCRAGELDIVAHSANLLVVAEVRLRSRRDYGGAAASITASKQRRIVRATRYLLRSRPRFAAMHLRFDVLLLDGADGRIEWLTSAFDAR